jgi:spermidine synthase
MSNNERNSETVKGAPAPIPLLLSVFVVATCGLVYELIAGALASYLLGDSVTQFSTVIGVYLFAMGVGSYLSRFVERDHLALFVKVELMVGILGGFSSTILFFCFAYGAVFPVALYGLVFLIGTGVGLEIPLLMNVLHGEMSFKDLVSRVLSFDYIGALVASVAFPLLLLPNLGLIRTALLFGIFNVVVSLLMAIAYHRNRRSMAFTRTLASAILVVMIVAFAYGDRLMETAEAAIYPEPIIHSSSTKYQRVVLTRSKFSLRLYLNGHLQFDSLDEYRYHEALVHVGLHRLPVKEKVLILGGGDGMAAREVLRYPDVKEITLVDLDPGMTTLFKGSLPLQRLNGNALTDPRVKVINDDAFVWLRSHGKEYDFVIIDFPDPTNFSLGKLYTTAFYREVHRVLAPHGIAVIQSTSPLMARKSYWCIEATVSATGLITKPYHAYVPSFGEWGFILATKSSFPEEGTLPSGLKFISEEVLPTLFLFANDMSKVDVEVNRLNTQDLVHYYEKEWERFGM